MGSLVRLKFALKSQKMKSFQGPVSTIPRPMFNKKKLSLCLNQLRSEEVCKIRMLSLLLVSTTSTTLISQQE